MATTAKKAARKTTTRKTTATHKKADGVENASEMLAAGVAVVEELTSKAKKAGDAVAGRGRKKAPARRKATA